MLVDNWAVGGGGAAWATLYNCLLRNNTGINNGGGSLDGKLYNCTLVDNRAFGEGGGGAYVGTLCNCIVYGNHAVNGTNYINATFIYSCTTPLPDGEGNISDTPLFVAAAEGNYRLLYGSPCIDTGATNQDWAIGTTDLDRRPRLVQGIVDMGAYEYDGAIADSDGDGMIDDWEAQSGLNPTNGNDTVEDHDADGMNNISEYIAGTDAANGDSVFAASSGANTVAGRVVLTWPGAAGRYYSVYWCADLTNGFELLATDLPGTPPVNSYTDTLHGEESQSYYRIKVRK